MFTQTKLKKKLLLFVQLFITLSVINAQGLDPTLKPFYYGVASGDPMQDAVIIWTHVTPKVDTGSVSVDWMVATDKEMTNVIASGTAVTHDSIDYTVKVDITGLTDGTTYYYMFNYMGANSIIGRTKTAPSASVDQLKLAVVTCSNYQEGYFNAYGKLAERNDLDAIVHLGDYFYEYGNGGYGFLVEERPLDPPHECKTLEDYRKRYAHYKLDSNLRKVHQQHPFILVWDVHESANDSWTGGAQNHNEGEGDWETRKAESKKAYYEWLPIRPKVHQGEKLYRKLSYGALADIIMLDTRLEGREEQIYPQTELEMAALYAPDRTLLGETQKEWLKKQLSTSTAKWKLVGSQVMFSEFNVGWAYSSLIPGSVPGLDTITYQSLENLFLDIWDGYPAERDTIINFISGNDIDNTVFLTGDFHTAFAYDVASRPSVFSPPGGVLNYNGETGEGSIAVEFMSPSISSANFDENLGLQMALGLQMLLNSPFPEGSGELTGINPNPHMKYLNLVDHGYFLLSLSDTSAQADYYYVNSITTPESDEELKASFVTIDEFNHLTTNPNAYPNKTVQEEPAPALPMPTTPENVYANTVYYDQINIIWDDAYGESEYILERSTDNENFEPIVTLGQDVTMYMDKSLADDSKLYYRILAKNDAFEAAYSDTVMAKTFKSRDFKITYKGNYDSGLGEGSAEIVAHDTINNRLFIVNAENNTVDIIDISNLDNIQIYDTINDLDNYGAGVNSVAIADTLVAVAVEGYNKQGSGVVVFYNLDGKYLTSYHVGALPDMITFSPDGRKVLVACEGEPNDDYTIDPFGTIHVIDFGDDITSATIDSVSFEDADSTALVNSGVRIFGPNASPARDLEPEYIALAVDGADTMVYVSCQENNAVVVFRLSNLDDYTIAPLGYKDHSLPGNALDASNRDNGINIKNWPIFGMYQPDAIAAFNNGSEIYVLSANEGDSREYEGEPGFVEEDRVKDLVLDPTAFPNADFLQEDENLGRIKTTLTRGDGDGDGDYDSIFVFGARSFSLWSGADGSLLYDSGDDFEQITAIQASEIFNAENTPDEFDSRSDDKGAEPEGITVGKVGDRYYAFIGLERQGGIMIYDVTHKDSVEFVWYEKGQPEDLAPEGLIFISAEQSPSGKPLVITSNEVSGTVAFYEIDMSKPEIETPATITSRSMGTTKTGIMWSSVEEADGYKLYRAEEEDGQYMEIASLSIYDTMYMDMDLEKFEDYFYTVKAFKASVQSEFSDTSEVSTEYVLQVLHASDLEGGVDAVENAPNFAAIVDKLEDEFDASVTISSGDNYIPGPFFNAAQFVSDEVFQEVYGEFYNDEENTSLISEGRGHIDISLMNIIGFDASAMGNHEFDAGTGQVYDLLSIAYEDGELEWLGTQFPYLTSNLDFSGDADLTGLFADTLLENTAYKHLPSEIDENTYNKKIAPYTFIIEDGDTIGVVGATTQALESITSHGGVEVKGPKEDDMDTLADTVQKYVDELVAMGIDKIIVTTHLQQIALEKELIGKLSNVDIILAGGSDVLMANENDVLHPGDEIAEKYPFKTINKDGEPAIIVGTDGEYSYVGRLVVRFDDMGIVDTNMIYPESGAYATVEEVVGNVWGDVEDAFDEDEITKGYLAKKLVDEVSAVVTAQDGNIIAKSSVYIDGRREKVRSEETNMGDLTADANLWLAQQHDAEIKVSLKNGGGIRAAIGEVVETSPGVYTFEPPQANPKANKEDGEVSQLDIVNSLRFNNGLAVIKFTAEELVSLLEHGVGLWEEGSTPGGFPQIGGMALSFDPSQPAGDRIQSFIIKDMDGTITDVLVQNGEIVGDPSRIIKTVTLDFLLNFDGDGYKFSETHDFGNRYFLVDSLTDEGKANFAIPGKEQDALAEYLINYFSGDNSFDIEETPIEEDERIQNLAKRADGLIYNAPAAPDGLKLTTQSVSQINLTWNDNADNELNYYVQRSLTDVEGDFVTIDTLEMNSTSYSDTGLVENTEYYYRIGAVNLIDTVFSNIANDTTLTDVGIEILTLSDLGLTIYPNPSDGIFNLDYSKDMNFVGTFITITDINGRIVFESLLTKDLKKVELNKQPAGVYFINIKSDNLNYFGRVIKK